MDFLEQCAAEQTAKVRKMKPKAKMWAQLTSEFGDVWHEIESVYLSNLKDKYFSHDWSSLYLYCHRKNERPVESFYFNKIRKVVNKLPENASVIICEEGYFSPRSGNLDQLPKRIKFEK